MQNPVLEAIGNRRSIRAYQPEQIDEAQLTAILEAGLAAPSASNAQPWHITVVQDPVLIHRINAAFVEQALKTSPPEMRERFEAPDYSVFYHAPTVIFLSCPEIADKHYAQTDTGMVIQNIALAAYSLGLGTVVLGMPRMAFDGPEADAFRQALGFPQGYNFILAISVGIPATTKEAHENRPDLVTILR